MNNAQLKYPYSSLDYVDDLVKAGFDEKQSKAQAKALFRVIEQNAVTKQDLKDLENKIAYDIKELDVKIKELETKLSYDMKELDVRLSTQMKELEVKLTHEMKEMGSNLLFKLSGIVGAMLTLSISVMGLLIHFLH